MYVNMKTLETNDSNKFSIIKISSVGIIELGGGEVLEFSYLHKLEISINLLIFFRFLGGVWGSFKCSSFMTLLSLFFELDYFYFVIRNYNYLY